MLWIADCLVQLAHSSAQAVITQTLRDAVPERALRVAADGGRRCSGWASDVVGGEGEDGGEIILCSCAYDAYARETE